jgi:UDPglucose 6-dehydrogenase
MIAFIGLSHLGIVYGAATAAKGMDVLGFDPDEELCAELTAERLPVSEPGLDALWSENRARLRFTSDPAQLAQCDLVFYSRDVPTDAENRSDLGPLRALIEQTSRHLSSEAIAVILCQVPPGFTASLWRRENARYFVETNNPSHRRRRSPLERKSALYYQVETLIFGAAVERALKPERYMIGCADPAAPLPDAYAKWLQAFDCPLLPMRYESAELAKIAINCYLVSTVSTTNTLAEICEHTGADWAEIAPALRLDKRIGPHAYLGPGLGIAGGNLERDLVTVQSLAALHGTEAGIVSAWQRNSRYRRDWALRKVHELVLARNPKAHLAIWGLAYKQDTHSTKNSPSLALLEALRGIPFTAYDPQVRVPEIPQAPTALEACRDADALVIMTPWKEFSVIAPTAIKAVLRGQVVIDPFGTLPATACQAAGFAHHQLGAHARP